jgi:hypothetical protein
LIHTDDAAQAVPLMVGCLVLVPVGTVVRLAEGVAGSSDLSYAASECWCGVVLRMSVGFRLSCLPAGVEDTEIASIESTRRDDSGGEAADTPSLQRLSRSVPYAMAARAVIAFRYRPYT